MNSHASEKFFSNAREATQGNAERFAKTKSAGTLRIFVLGESTTIGYPYMHNGSFHRMLQYRLLHEYPGQKFEIINLSLTAVNSYTVLNFAGQIGSYSPDAVLIYCGHNEYYGALGVASTNRINTSPFIMKTIVALRQFRTYQLLTRGFNKVRSWVRPENNQATLMKRMAANAQIEYGSPLYYRGIEQFTQNMTKVCELLLKQNIPVFLSNLVSNEKSLKPFASSRDSLSAEKRFRQGQYYLSQGRITEARKEFVAAKDYDLVRFRAPEQMNAIIENLCATFRNVKLVNTRSVFQKHSKNGILGDETLLEHVHPNLAGYKLMSDAFYWALRQSKLLPDPQQHYMTFQNFAESVPVTRVDSIKGSIEIMMLKAKWPFNETPGPVSLRSFEERLAYNLLMNRVTWNQTLDTLLPYYVQAGQYMDAQKVAESSLLEYPYEPVFYMYAGKYSLKAGRNSEAILYLQKNFELQPTAAVARQLLDLYLSADQPSESLKYVNYLATMSNHPGNTLLTRKNYLQQIIYLKDRMTRDSSVRLLSTISLLYKKVGCPVVALKYEQAAKRSSPTD